jgi:hypothetical protein
MSAKQVTSAKRRQATSGSGQSTSAPDVADSFSPPRKSRWQLVVSSILVALWLIFLAWMAFGG